MPRPAGVRNRDFEEKRDTLLNALTDFALNADLRRPSLRQFALAVGASEPTLRHYFGDRRGVVMAILENIGARGQRIWTVVATPAGSARDAVSEYYRVSEAGMRHGGFIRAHAFGLIEGLADEEIGQAYLQHVLEPALDAISMKLGQTAETLTDRGARRAASLALLSPLLVLSLHQDLLGGETRWPIDSAEVIAHLEAWLGRGLAVEAARDA